MQHFFGPLPPPFPLNASNLFKKEQIENEKYKQNFLLRLGDNVLKLSKNV